MYVIRLDPNPFQTTAFFCHHHPVDFYVEKTQGLTIQHTAPKNPKYPKMGNTLHKKNASTSSKTSSNTKSIGTKTNITSDMATQAFPDENQAEVVLIGCGAPNRGMGWWHAVQMLKGQVPHAKLCYVVEPWFLGPGRY